MKDFQSLLNDINKIDDFIAFHEENIKRFICDKNKPHIYSCDIDNIELTGHEIKSWKEYLTSSYFRYFLSGEEMEEGKITDLHPYLPVNPYSGDLIRAKVIFLLLNPGVSPINYFQNESVFKTRREQYDYLLDAELRYPGREWSMGFKYAIKILKPILQYARQNEINETDALCSIRKNVAVLQLSPYPSIEFNSSTAHFQTSRLAKRALEILLNDENKHVICLRGYNYWSKDLTPNKINKLIHAPGRTPSLRKIQKFNAVAESALGRVCV